MSSNQTKLKRVLGFAPAYGAAVGLVVSGTAMFSVGNVTGTAGYSAPISALIALIPMMVAAFAFGELTAMLPGGGMVSDYTLPALGRFWATFSLLSGYLVLISTDGGTQLVMGGLSMEALCGVPQIIVTLSLFLIVLVINILNVDFYGKIESVVTILMMIVFAAFAISANLRLGEKLSVATPLNNNLNILPEGGWGTVLNTTGAAIWFFIGFEFACPMAEENKRPHKNIPYALIFGLITIYIIDSLFAVAATRYSDLTVLSTSAIPQTEASRAMLGNIGYITMTVLTIMASFTTANAYMASFPRMLYGLSRQGLVPKLFGVINRKYRTPINGIIFTSFLILATVTFIAINGANVGVVQGMINTACITWMVSYAIVMIDVLVLRKRYPDFPRLWKAPVAKFTMPIGLIGVVYAIYTLKDYLVYSLICMVVIALYCLIWGKMHKIELFKPTELHQTVQEIRNRSEYLPEWDEAVDVWCREHTPDSKRAY